MTMVPPNQKVWAERNYDVEKGLTAGEDRTYTIGAEGAALTSDTTVTIYTEWLDEFGRPLSEELGLDDGEQYGLTCHPVRRCPFHRHSLIPRTRAVPNFFMMGVWDNRRKITKPYHI
jgi:hypothetical protein